MKKKSDIDTVKNDIQTDKPTNKPTKYIFNQSGNDGEVGEIVSLYGITPLNSSFDVAKLRIAYPGLNNNKMYISKEAFEHAAPTMFNCPIVGYYSEITDDFVGHEVKVEKNDNGKYEVINVTQPLGVVPESADWWWETVLTATGEKEYLTTEVILWRRQEAYQKIKENGITAQSMEIEVFKSHKIPEGVEVDNFIFTAFCLLGSGVSPCFEDAALYFSTNESEKFNNEFKEMIQEYSLNFNKNSDDDALKNFTEKGENMKKKNIDATVVANIDEPTTDNEKLDFSATDTTDKYPDVQEPKNGKGGDEPAVTETAAEPAAEQTETFNADTEADDDYSEAPTEEPTSEPADDSKSDSDVQNFTLNGNIREQFRLIARENTGYGSSRHTLILDFYDYDSSKQEVYFYRTVEREDYFNTDIVGTTYEIVNDEVVVDMEHLTVKVFELRDFVGADQIALDAVETTEVYKKLKSDYEFLLEQYNALKLSCAQELLMKFSTKLKDNSEFKALQDHALDYSLDELTEKLYALVGKTSTNFSLSRQLPSVGVAAFDDSGRSTDAHDSRYGDLFEGIK